MYLLTVFYVSIYFMCYGNCKGKDKQPKPYVMKKPSAKFDNPFFVRDRLRDEIWKPELQPEIINRWFPNKPYHPAWQDWCAPYHCNDYHKRACGLNRKNMRFKWFQSQCHVKLNNLCAGYTGGLRYDVVDTRWCTSYARFLLRSSDDCHRLCSDRGPSVCARSTIDGHYVIFKNECRLKMHNCESFIEHEYQDVDIEKCELYVNYALFTLKNYQKINYTNIN